jgi:hypothetical protein
MATSFEDIWVPRIGKEATRVLRRYGYAVLVCPLLMLTCAGICSFAYSNGSTSGLVIGFLVTFVGVAAFGVLIRSSMQVAAALSAHFDVRIRWTELPSLGRLNRFDAWCAKRGLGAGVE